MENTTVNDSVITDSVIKPTEKVINTENVDNVERAIQKLKSMISKASDKEVAELIGEYLIERVNADSGVAEDVLIENKTLTGCIKYIRGEAQKKARGKSCVAIGDSTVFEWAEDYFHAADTVTQTKKEKTQTKKAETSTEKTETSTKEEVKPAKAETKSVKEKQPEKVTQLSIFDLM